MQRAPSILIALTVTASASIPTPLVIPQSADASVSRLYLLDSSSKERVLPADLVFDRNADIPYAVLLSSDRKQALTVFTHPGGVSDIAEVRVQFATGPQLPAQHTLKAATFVSGKGIELGITEAQVVGVLGKPQHRLVEGTSVTLEYRIEAGSEEAEGEAFLAHYNMPNYYGTYTFESDRLFAFQFGFEYP